MTFDETLLSKAQDKNQWHVSSNRPTVFLKKDTTLKATNNTIQLYFQFIASIGLLEQHEET